MNYAEIITKIADPVSRLACRKCKETFDISGREMLSLVTCPKCDKEQSVPARMSDFLLIEPLGVGGMAGVFKAYDETLGRMVAIKVLRPEAQKDEEGVAKFIQEARAAAQLNHPNIVQVYTVGKSRGQAFMVMELLDGGRLDEMISADREVDEARVLEIGMAIANGLQRAYEIGLTHGDIKPANILFDRRKTPKIADFGLARFKGAATARGEVWGTPYYIAPEKVRKQKEDHRSDIYSLGATLYHALGGQPPFDGRTATDVVVARLKEPPLRIDTLRDNLNPVTAEVISRMLEADRMLRYPTYASLIADLKRALTEVRNAPPGSRAKAKPRRRAGVWVGGAVVLAAVAGLAAWLLVDWDEPDPFLPPDVPPVADVDEPEPEAPEPEDVPDVYSVQPFTAEQGARLAATLRGISERLLPEIEEELIAQVRALDRDHAGRPWYAFWYAVPVWLRGDTDEAASRLRALRERTFEPPEDGGIATGTLAQALAHVVAGEPFDPPGRPRPSPIPDESPDTETDTGEPAPEEEEPSAEEPEVDARELPDWYLDVADFIVGLRELSVAESRPAGRLRLARYLEAEPRDHAAWAYAGHPVAERWLERADAWEAYRDATLGKLESEIDDDLLNELQGRRQSVEWGLFRSDVHEVFRTAQRQQRNLRRRAEREQRRTEQAALRDTMAAEREVTEAALREVAARVRNLDFRAAAEQWDEKTRSIETDEVRAEANAMREALERMSELKLFLAREIRRRSYPHAQSQVRGTVVRADRSGVEVELATGIGSVEYHWSRVGPRVFSEMVTFYLRETSVADPERGELAAGLAVFLHLNGATRPAVSAAANAVRWNPDTADSLRRIIPDAFSEVE